MQQSRSLAASPPKKKAGRRAGSRHPRSRNSSARLDEGCAQHCKSRGDAARVYFEEKRCHGETSAIISPAIISPSWHGWRLPPPAAQQRCSPRCSPTPSCDPRRAKPGVPSPARPPSPPLGPGPEGPPPRPLTCPSPSPAAAAAAPRKSGPLQGRCGAAYGGRGGRAPAWGWGWHGRSGLSSSLGEA